MASTQLDLIRRYCDTTGVHLNSQEKDILCMVLENPSKFDGFISKHYVSRDSGRDYRGWWDSTMEWQYRINIDSRLSIDEQCRHEADGYVHGYWGWENAHNITNIRQILKILFEIESEL